MAPRFHKDKVSLRSLPASSRRGTQTPNKRRRTTAGLLAAWRRGVWVRAHEQSLVASTRWAHTHTHTHTCRCVHIPSACAGTHMRTHVYTPCLCTCKNTCAHAACTQRSGWRPLFWPTVSLPCGSRGCQVLRRQNGLQMCHPELPPGPCSASRFYEEILGVLRPLLGLAWSLEHIGPFKRQFWGHQTLIQGGSHPPDPRKAV